MPRRPVTVVQRTDLALETVAETAQRLKVSRGTVFNLVRIGALESIRIGRSRRIISQSVDEFITQRRKASVA